MALCRDGEANVELLMDAGASHTGFGVKGRVGVASAFSARSLSTTSLLSYKPGSGIFFAAEEASQMMAP
jgi:hypothetical protein